MAEAADAATIDLPTLLAVIRAIQPSNALKQLAGTTEQQVENEAGPAPSDDDRKMPGPGFIPGKLMVDPRLMPDPPNPALRPFAPGEWNRNPDGGWSSEESMTVEHPTDEGKWSNIPSLWLKDGKAYVASGPDEARKLAKESGFQWPAYNDEQAANAAADAREKQWNELDEPWLSPAAKTAISEVSPLYIKRGLQSGGALMSDDQKPDKKNE